MLTPRHLLTPGWAARSLTVALLVAGCGSPQAADPATVADGPTPAATETAEFTETTETTETAGGSTESTEPAAGGSDLPATAPEADRIDLQVPTFTDPTAITNPLFPITEVEQFLQIGTEGEDRLHFEITLLPDVRTIEWDGQQIDTRVHQFVAYANGRILEVATDFFAQADHGAVWYFGEDVFNYEDGVVADTEGTWLAGADGPPGMIMAGDPQVDDVYRPENIPDLVFEEVTVQSTTETVGGPSGPIEGALLVREALLDGTLEDKVFAPGYGEFRANVASEDELVTLAVAVPIDAVDGPLPTGLDALPAAAVALVTDPPADVTAAAAGLSDTWAQARADTTPPMIAEAMEQSLSILETAVADGDGDATAQAGLDVALRALDAQLQYRTPAEVDLDRMGVWAQRLVADEGEAGDVAGDVVALETIWARVGHTVPDDAAGAIAGHLELLRAAVEAGSETGSGATGLIAALDALS